MKLPFDDTGTASAGQVYQGSPRFLSELIVPTVRPTFSGSECQEYVPGLSASTAAPVSGKDETIPVWRNRDPSRFCHPAYSLLVDLKRVHSSVSQKLHQAGLSPKENFYLKQERRSGRMVSKAVTLRERERERE